MSLRGEADGDQAHAACQVLGVHGLIYPIYYIPEVGIMNPNLQVMPDRTIVILT